MQSQEESVDEGCEVGVFAEEHPGSFSTCCCPGWEDILAPVELKKKRNRSVQVNNIAVMFCSYECKATFEVLLFFHCVCSLFPIIKYCICIMYYSLQIMRTIFAFISLI